MKKIGEFDFTGILDLGHVLLTEPAKYRIRFNSPVQGIASTSATGRELLQSADENCKPTLREQFNEYGAVDVEGRVEIVANDTGDTRPRAVLTSIQKATPRPEFSGPKG